MKEKSFVCLNCHNIVVEKAIGTKNRNHCPYCLWSLHVDEKIPGDRKSNCKSLMKPISLDFKKVKKNKYKNSSVVGEILIVHQCLNCQKVTKNRMSGDDDPSLFLSLCPKEHKKEVQEQLYGSS